jgi:alkylhydroperoxidase family enzyme
VARLDPVPDSSLALSTRFWFFLSRRVFGRVTRPLRIHARVPRLVSAVMIMNGLLGTGRWEIGRELTTLIALRVAMLVGCVF